MLTFAPLLAAQAPAAAPGPHLVAYWKGDNMVDTVTGQSAKAMGGVTFEPGPFGKGFDFGGEASVVWFPDSSRFQLDKGLTLSAWVLIHTLPKYGSSPQAPIIFRGDDRDGLDPYVLAAESAGTFAFGICNDANQGAEVHTPAIVGRWVHLCATWDGSTKLMKLYENGQLVAQQQTDIVPLKALDPNYHPGISIGNVQNPFGDRHYQPLNGTVAEVKIYDGPLAKPDFVKPKNWDN